MHQVRRALAFADRFNQPIEDFANLFASIAIFALMCLGVAQIVMRSFLNRPINGYIDLVELSMASMAFLGAAYCQRLGAHIRMELVVRKLKGRILWLAESFALAVALIIIAVLIWYGWGHFIRSFTLGDTTIDAEFVVWPSKILVPIAFAIWWIRLAIQFVGSTLLFIDPTAEPVGVVQLKDVAEQAQDEITDIMGDEVKPTGERT